MSKIQRGEWHDGRLDCVAGNGIMSELGIGDEKFGPDDAEAGADENELLLDTGVLGEDKPNGDHDAMEGLPVVVIRGFEDKVGGKSELLDVVAEWATSLVDNRVSELPSSPLEFTGSPPSFRSHTLSCSATTEKTPNGWRKVSDFFYVSLSAAYGGL